MNALHWLKPGDRNGAFPSVDCALADPDGLLAIGGDLSVSRLLEAYRRGIFPWYSEGQPILWWSPDPRLVLTPDRIHVSKSLRKTLRRNRFRISMDTAFDEVITRCAAPRYGQSGTWITREMCEAYGKLHRQGFAHSVEIHDGDELVGGLYGVSIGRAFFGESMFSALPNASKIALVYLGRQLARWDFPMIDCQVRTEHLVSMGATEISRRDFVDLIERACGLNHPAGRWRYDPGIGSTLAGQDGGGDP